MQHGLSTARYEGTPQRGPLSPLFANLLLDDLDKELEGRGHRFCRYADNCNIHVRSPAAGERIMASVIRFLQRRLRLRVNQQKSAPGLRRGRLAPVEERKETLDYVPGRFKVTRHIRGKFSCRACAR
jgi:RNA-directed DNA polymerase